MFRLYISLYIAITTFRLIILPSIIAISLHRYFYIVAITRRIRNTISIIIIASIIARIITRIRFSISNSLNSSRFI